MSICKIKSRGTPPRKMKDYLEKQKKELTEDKDSDKSRAVREGCINISDQENWAEEMYQTKRSWDNTGGVELYHIILSPDPDNPDERLNPDRLESYAREWAEPLADEGYEIAYAVHLDTGKPHIHIAINSVNAADGHKLDLNNQVFWGMKERTAQLDKKYGLYTEKESRERRQQLQKQQGQQLEAGRSDAEYYTAQRKPGSVWKDEMRNKLQSIFSRPDITNEDEFRAALASEGLEISRETGTGHITYMDAGNPMHRSRASRLGAFDRSDVMGMYRDHAEELRREAEAEQQRQQETQDDAEQAEKEAQNEAIKQRQLAQQAEINRLTDAANALINQAWNDEYKNRNAKKALLAAARDYKTEIEKQIEKDLAATQARMKEEKDEEAKRREAEAEKEKTKEQERKRKQAERERQRESQGKERKTSAPQIKRSKSKDKDRGRSR